MKLLIIGDLHLRGNKLRDISSAWERAIVWANQNKVDLICQAGDVFDHANVYGRNASTGSIYDAMILPFFEQSKPVPLFAIAGNHDLSSPKDKDALAPIDRYPWITVARKPGVIDINDQLAICAVPWINKAHLVSKLITQGMKAKEASTKVHDAIVNMMTPLTKGVSAAKQKGKFVLFLGHLEVTGAKREGGTIQSGGSFEFTPLELASVGADAYALAHIHVRQSIPSFPNRNDGYVGALCQLSFGEENQQVGCRLLEIDKSKIVDDKWLDNKTSPRYINAMTLEGIQYRSGIDYVKLKGLVRPETMPPGIIFEKLPAQIDASRRSDKKLEAFMPLSILLEEWKNKNNCDIPLELLVDQAEFIKSQNPTQSDPIGSLERIERIHLENLTSHSSTDVITDFDGICGICGPNGAGKSTFIETISLAPYGTSPSHPGLFTLLPNGDSVDSVSELVFISSGKRYRIRREFSKRKKTITHQAFVYKEDEKEPVAGPKVSDVYKFCSDLIGAEDLVLAGVFSSQGDAGNVTKFKDTARKDLFGKLLGTDQFLVYADAAKKLSAADIAIVEAKMSRIATIKNTLATEERERNSLQEIEETIASKEKMKVDVSKGLEEARSKNDLIKEKQKEHQRGNSEKLALEQQLNKILSEGKALKVQKEEFQATDIESLERELKEARKTKEQIQEIDGKLAEISEKKAIAAEAAMRANAQYTKISVEHIETINEIKTKLQTVRTTIADLEAKKIEAERRSGLLSAPSFPNLKECQTCPLAADIFVFKNSLPGLEEEIKKHKAVLKRGMDKLAAAEAEANKVELDFEESSKTETFVVPVELLQKKKELEKTAIKAIALENKLLAMQKSKEDISKIEARMESLRTSFKELDAKIKAFVVPAKPAQEEVEESNKTMTFLQDRIVRLDEDLKGFNVELGKKTSVVDGLKKMAEEMNNIEEEIKDKRQKVDVLSGLLKAFGRDGIPQMIVDSAIPHLNDIIYDLLSDCDGRWSMRVSSFREDSKGKIAERVDVLVDDGEWERDISTYSGGERNFLEYIFRVAFSILQSERSGKGLKVLALDEPMYFADEAVADNFMRMLKKLTNNFSQIFIISHSDYILSSIDSKMYFNRNSDGETVVQCDFLKTEKK